VKAGCFLLRKMSEAYLDRTSPWLTCRVSGSHTGRMAASRELSSLTPPRCGVPASARLPWRIERRGSQAALSYSWTSPNSCPTPRSERHGTIPGSLHVPYPALQESIRSGGMLHELARSTGKRLLFYCAFGERSAMAVRAAQDAGHSAACHIEGGLDAWKKAGGPLTR
jgi:rhodanese-related sulfurtransferase